MNHTQLIPFVGVYVDVWERLANGGYNHSVLNRALSVWGQQETGLPIDFQVQRQTEANAEFSGTRIAMGFRDWIIELQKASTP